MARFRRQEEAGEYHFLKILRQLDNRNASITVAIINFRSPCDSMASITLTLKNIPPHVHRGLKAQAQRHKRSLNQEAILCLEQALASSGERPSLASPPLPVSAGALLQPWSSRAEMLGDFLDHSRDS